MGIAWAISWTFVGRWLVWWLILSAAYSVVGLLIGAMLLMIVQSRRLARWRLVSWMGALLFMAVGLITVYTSPRAYELGQWIKFLYFHVPSALFALLTYSIVLGSSVRQVMSPHSLAGASIKVLAPIGGAFTLLALVTGAIWGRWLWGVWAWELKEEARVTSTLALLFIYLGLIVLCQLIRDSSKAKVATIIFAFAGALDLPVIYNYNSGIWWRRLNLHGPNVLPDVSRIDRVFLWPLGLMTLAFVFVFVALYLSFMNTQLLGRGLNQVRLYKRKCE